jgi:hypothetical protein
MSACFRKSSALLNSSILPNPADFISRLSALDTEGSSSMMNMAGSVGFKGFLPMRPTGSQPRRGDRGFDPNSGCGVIWARFW